MTDCQTTPAALPLTLGQLDFWEEFLAHPGQPVSTVAHLTQLDGAVDAEALARAIETVAAEAEVLSLRFQAGAGGDLPVQFVDPASRPALRRFDLRGHSDPQAAARALIQADLDRPMDLCAGQLSALWLMQVGPQSWLWYCRGHHIFLDGYSMALIERRVAQLYAHLAHGADAGRPFAHFADYLAEESAYRDSPRHQAARDFWRDTLAAGPAPQVLLKGSEDYPTNPRSAEISLAHLEDPLRQAARRLDQGWPDLLIMLCALWLNANPDSDLAPPTQSMVWLPLMGRMGSISAQVPAMVLNIAPLRVAPDARASLGQALTRMAGDLKAMRRHGRCRIEQIDADYGLAEDQRFFFSPLINVMPFEPAHFPDCQTRREVLAAGPGDGFNITIAADPMANGLTLYLDADPRLTSAQCFDHHRNGLPRFLARALAAPAEATLESLLAGALHPA